MELNHAYNEKANTTLLLDISQLLYAREYLYEGNFHSNLHTHNHTEIFYVTEGLGSFLFNMNSCNVSKGCVLVINGNVPHTEVSSKEKPLRYIVLGIKGIENLEHQRDNEDFILINNQDSNLLSLFKCLVREFSTDNPISKQICSYLTKSILLKLSNRIEFMPEPLKYDTQKGSKECAAIRRYIDVHHKENITLEALSNYAHISKYYMVHSFKKEYGISPIRYLQYRRIAESKDLLKETQLSASQISQITGFSSASQFAQCFKRLTAVTPSEYRKMARDNR